MTIDNKKYPDEFKKGIRGQAFFESLICKDSIPHPTEGLKDLGIDYFCEWVKGSDPSGYLFAVQVKASTVERTIPKEIDPVPGIDNNGLRVFEFTGEEKFTIDEKTRNYWRGLGMPVFLFVFLEYDASTDECPMPSCYYKRYTPIITKDLNQSESHFYKVSEDKKFGFRAFASKMKNDGFARDFYIDLVRCRYFMGSLTSVDPKKVGLENVNWNENSRFSDLFREYKDIICKVHLDTQRFLIEIGEKCEPKGSPPTP